LLLALSLLLLPNPVLVEKGSRYGISISRRA
jgi:hypothetical protein